MPRATKIVATLGPASSDPEVLERLLRAGVDVVRLNFSHGKAQDHIDRANLVRSIAQKVGKPVALMADLQGPKIRVGKFADGKVQLVNGERFVLDAAREAPGALGRSPHRGGAVDVVLRLAVAEVQPHHIHARADHGLQQCRVAGGGAQGGNDLGGAACWHVLSHSVVM